MDNATNPAYTYVVAAASSLQLEFTRGRLTYHVCYAQEVRKSPEKIDLTESRTFIESFVKRFARKPTSGLGVPGLQTHPLRRDVGLL